MVNSIDFFTAVEQNNLETMKSELEKGIDVLSLDSKENTALHIAVRKGNKIAVELLLQYGAAIHARNKNGETPLFLAECRAQQEILNLLWYHQAALDKLLIEAAEKGTIDQVKETLKRGANINAKDKKGDTALHKATQNRHPDVERFLLENGADRAAENALELTALHFSKAYAPRDEVGLFLQKQAINEMLRIFAEKGTIDRVKELLEEGAGVDAKDKNGNTALHKATQNQHPDIVQLLLDSGADSDIRNGDGQTPLSLAKSEDIIEIFHRHIEKDRALLDAAEKGAIDQVKEALKRGANINAKDKKGDTALHKATQNRHPDVERFLLENGADRAAENALELTALHFSKAYAPQDIEGLLQQKRAINEMLRIFAEKGSIDRVKELLEQGANIDAKDENKNTALHKATQNQHPAIVQLLLDSGADSDVRNRDGQTPFSLAKSCLAEAIIEIFHRHIEKNKALIDAAEKGTIDRVKELLEKGANINGKDENKNTALHKATQNRRPDIVQLLLENGAYVHAKNSDFVTPLHLAKNLAFPEITALFSRQKATNRMLLRAAKNGNIDDVKEALNKGANIHAKDPEENSSLHHAVWKKHTEVSRFLIKKGANVDGQNVIYLTPLLLTKTLFYSPYMRDLADEVLLDAAEKGDFDRVQEALCDGANIHAQDKNENTALHHATCDKHTKITQYLLERGADPNAKNCVNCTPLHCAAGAGDVLGAELLIEKKAKINVKGGSDGWTPVHYAVHHRQEEVLALLIQYKADLGIQDDDEEETALHYAIRRNHTSIATLLIQSGAPMKVINGRGMNALTLAIYCFSEELVKVILEKDPSMANSIIPWSPEGDPSDSMTAYQYARFIHDEYVPSLHRVYVEKLKPKAYKIMRMLETHQRALAEDPVTL